MSFLRKPPAAIVGLIFFGILAGGTYGVVLLNQSLQENSSLLGITSPVFSPSAPPGALNPTDPCWKLPRCLSLTGTADTGHICSETCGQQISDNGGLVCAGLTESIPCSYPLKDSCAGSHVINGPTGPYGYTTCEDVCYAQQQAGMQACQLDGSGNPLPPNGKLNVGNKCGMQNNFQSCYYYYKPYGAAECRQLSSPAQCDMGLYCKADPGGTGEEGRIISGTCQPISSSSSSVSSAVSSSSAPAPNPTPQPPTYPPPPPKGVNCYRNTLGPHPGAVCYAGTGPGPFATFEACADYCFDFDSPETPGDPPCITPSIEIIMSGSIVLPTCSSSSSSSSSSLLSSSLSSPTSSSSSSSSSASVVALAPSSSSSMSSSPSSSASSVQSSSSLDSSSSVSSFFCTNDNQCPLGQYCSNGTCMQGCRSDADCSIGTCINHQCVPCGNDNECPSGQVCRNGGCVVSSASSSRSSSVSSSRSSSVSSSSSQRSSMSSVRSSSSSSSSSVIIAANGYCCVAGSCTQFAGCALTLNSCQSVCGRSSSMSSSSTSVTLVAGVCFSDECSAGGDALCAGRGQQCVTTGSFPCVQCQAIQCADDNQCPAGSICTNGTCAPGCRTDDQCPAGNVCTNGTCTAACTDDSQCGAGQICEAGRCINGCTSNSQCRAGEACVNGRCLFQGCRNDAECPLGQFCNAGTCAQGCKNDNECIAGRCINHRCLPCSNDKECLAGEKCINGQCAVPTTLSLAQICGNGKTEAGEQCDDGSANSDASGARCRTNCSFNRCGDGITDAQTEECDAGSANGNGASGCDSLCRIAHSAGDVLPGTIIELPFSPTQIVETPLTSSVITSPTPPTNTDSGPATLAIMAMGAAGGWAWMRRRVKRI